VKGKTNEYVTFGDSTPQKGWEPKGVKGSVGGGCLGHDHGYLVVCELWAVWKGESHAVERFATMVLSATA